MVDWQQHERELRGARLAEDVLRSARRSAARRRLLAAAAVVAVIGVGVPAAVSWAGRPGSSEPAAVAPSVSAGSVLTPRGAAREPESGAADAVALYRLVLRGPHPGPRGVVVTTRTCPGASARPVQPCRGAVIPQSVRAALSRALPGLRFAAAATWPRGADDPVVIGLGPVRIAGDRASVEAQTFCGPLCGSGLRWEFARRGDRWTVLRSTGMWIS